MAGREPARSRPTFSVLYPDEAPTKVILDPVFNPKTFWNENPNEGWIAGSALDPLTEALEVARTKRVDPGEFRTLSEDASRLRLFVGRDFQVWEVPARKTRDGKTCHNRRRRVRLGAAVSGFQRRRCWEVSRACFGPGFHPPGIREVMGVLRSPAQVGYPPSIATDAHLGFSVMAYQ